MAKISIHAKVYNALNEASGAVSVADLLAIEGVLQYKLSAYILYAKLEFGAVIRAIRQGRNVIAYEMTDPGTRKKTTAPSPIVQQEPEVNVHETSDSVLSNDIITVFDEVDSFSSSFEDREYAEEYVRGLG